MKILIVDDNKDITEIAGTYLSMKHDIHTFNNSVEVLEHYNEGNNYDIIITDYYMPDIFGDKLIEMIFETNPNQKFIIISSGPNTDKLDLFMQKYKYQIRIIWKPYNLTDLDKAIDIISD